MNAGNDSRSPITFGRGEGFRLRSVIWDLFVQLADLGDYLVLIPLIIAQ
jgi:hypothetical protein